MFLIVALTSFKRGEGFAEEQSRGALRSTLRGRVADWQPAHEIPNYFGVLVWVVCYLVEEGFQWIVDGQALVALEKIA